MITCAFFLTVLEVDRSADVVSFTSFSLVVLYDIISNWIL